MDNSGNLYEEAGKFLRSKLDMRQFEKELTAHFQEKNMTQDEQNLFAYYLETQFQLTATVAKIKSGLKRYEAEKKEG